MSRLNAFAPEFIPTSRAQAQSSSNPPTGEVAQAAQPMTPAPSDPSVSPTKTSKRSPKAIKRKAKLGKHDPPAPSVTGEMDAAHAVGEGGAHAHDHLVDTSQIATDVALSALSSQADDQQHSSQGATTPPQVTSTGEASRCQHRTPEKTPPLVKVVALGDPTNPSSTSRVESYDLDSQLNGVKDRLSDSLAAWADYFASSADFRLSQLFTDGSDDLKAAGGGISVARLLVASPILLFFLPALICVFPIYLIICLEKAVLSHHRATNHIVSRCAFLRSAWYAPAPWFLSNHLQTSLQSLGRSWSKVPYETWLYVFFYILTENTRSEILQLPNGSHVGIDWLNRDVDAAKPTVVLLHGATGKSREPYMQECAKALARKGYRVACWNRQGCGDVTLQIAEPYLYGDYGSFGHVLSHISTKFPKSKIGAIGFSMGGNIVARYLQEFDEDSCLLSAAVSVCNPVDLVQTSINLPKPFFGLYNKKLTGELKSVPKKAPHVIDAAPHLDYEAMMKSRNVREFDAAFGTVAYEFDDVDSFYNWNSSVTAFRNNPNPSESVLSKPLLWLHAHDDPLVPPCAAHLDLVMRDPNVIALTTRRGGHVGWIDSWIWPSGCTWGEKLAIQYVTSELSA